MMIYLIGGTCAAGLFLLSALIHQYTEKIKYAQHLLQQAKQEAKDIAQLPLFNPSAMIQINEQNEILFKNPAAMAQFPDLEGGARNHAIFYGLVFPEEDDQTTYREISVKDKEYIQIISPSRVSGRKACILYFTDITDLKNKERELLKAQYEADKSRKAAENANKARGEFLANMSHELRTPMNGIIGLSEILTERDLKLEEKEMATAVHNSAKGLLNLLNDILDFSKIEAGELRIEHIPFSLTSVIEQIRFIHEHTAQRKGLKLNITQPEIQQNSIISDPVRLQQILNNLLGNALKFTENGSVDLALSLEKQKTQDILKIIISDTGIGIPQDKQAQIFEKFQQAETSTSRKYGGTGLGLSITKDLAHMMGGTITLESKEGAGTTFMVELPVKISEAVFVESQTQNRQKQPYINDKADILIVDDHPVNLLYLRQTLKRFGAKLPDEAASGKEALDMANKKRYDLIFMDCQMPDMDGFTAARMIHKENGLPHIIAVTADAMKGAEERCRASGMDDYISKPVDSEKLKLLLQELIPAESIVQEPTEPQFPPQTDMDAQIAEGQPLNWKKFDDFSAGDPELAQTMIEIFIRNLKTDLTNLQLSYLKHDYGAWDEAAHKLYGASSHIGADKLAEYCEQAQSMETPRPEIITHLHRQIIEESKAVHQALVLKQAA